MSECPNAIAPTDLAKTVASLPKQFTIAHSTSTGKCGHFINAVTAEGTYEITMMPNDPQQCAKITCDAGQTFIECEEQNRFVNCNN